MKVAYSRHGTRHVVSETIVEDERREIRDGRPVTVTRGNYVAECDRTVYGESECDPMLEAFPEDFGCLVSDCKDCSGAVAFD